MHRHRPPRPLARTRFLVERLLLRGPQYRLLFIAAVLGLLSVVGGLLVLPSGGFSGWPEATWWAFLRLSDPGYLGDDTGTFVRIVSTFLTVAGYVVFLGSLVAIMTQWLNSTIARLERGTTPVSRAHHVVILGWTNRTIPIVRELLLSEERVRRFLHVRGARGLHIVILADEVNHTLRQELREQLGSLFEEGGITLRSGSHLRVDHLDRVDFLRAGVILVPGSDLSAQGEGAVALDTRTIKTLLSVDEAARARRVDPPPQVVVEIHDSRKIALARRSYRGPGEFVASDAVLARLMAQNLRHPGLSHVYGELLAQGDGNEIYLPEAGDLEGTGAHELTAAFPRGVVLGLVRSDGTRVRPLLNPGPELRVQAGDRIVTLARHWSHVQPGARARPGPMASQVAPTPPVGEAGDARGHAEPRRILVLGWSPKIPAFLRELSSYREEAWEVDVLSRVDPGRRAQILERHGVDSERPTVRHLEGDLTVHGELVRVNPLGYDGIVLPGGDAHRSGEEADARTLLGALLLRELSEKRERVPPILVELLDPANESLLARGPGEVLVTPILVSHVLAQVALRPELRAVFDELFTAGGPEIRFLAAAHWGLAGRVDFPRLQAEGAARGATVLGVRPSGERPELNPDRGTHWDAGALDLVLLWTPDDAGGRGGGAADGNGPLDVRSPS